jgi:hypothetical protein
MEAEAVVDMILDDYPDLKFWVSFQCKVIIEYFLSNPNCRKRFVDASQVSVLNQAIDANIDFRILSIDWSTFDKTDVICLCDGSISRLPMVRTSQSQLN